MDVLKFGGTSVGSADTIRRVVDIISDSANPKIVVLSAMSGVTNLLVGLHQAALIQDRDTIEKIMEALTEKHHHAIDELFTEAAKQPVLDQINGMLESIYEIAVAPLKPTSYAELVTYGETLLTTIFSNYLTQQGLQNILLDAKTFMHVGSTENPNVGRVADLLKSQLEKHTHDRLFITQGFVCLDEDQSISTLKRGGSDFSATIIGAAINATAVQIWTDIDGLHNNDPRYVDETRPIEH
ncbi:MAG: aspartate kinase, partial [Leeuwenhoekiella sp.]